MGVHGLWKLIESAGKPVPVETLDNKVLAVDVSIWLHQLMKGYQTPAGGSVSNAYLIGLFSRVCKLLFTNVKPVFVFDGGVPQLKKKTIAARQQQKSRSAQAAEKVREQLLKNLLKQKAVGQVLEEIRGTGSPKKQAPDMFELPPLPENESESEVEEMSDSESEEDVKPMKMKYRDLHSVDVKSAEFKCLPTDMRHDILTELKETRKQNSWGRLHEMPEESGDFSQYQMARLLKRRSVQVSLEEAEKEMGGRTLNLQDVEALLAEGGVEINPQLSKRIASDNVTRFIYVTETGEPSKSSQSSTDKIDTENSKTSQMDSTTFSIVKIKEEPIEIESDDSFDVEFVKEVEAIEMAYSKIKQEKPEQEELEPVKEVETIGMAYCKIKQEKPDQEEFEPAVNEEFAVEGAFDDNSDSEGVIIDELDLIKDNSGLSQDQILALIKKENENKLSNAVFGGFVNIPSSSGENKTVHSENESSEDEMIPEPSPSKSQVSDISQNAESTQSKILDSLYFKIYESKLQSALSKKSRKQNHLKDQERTGTNKKKEIGNVNLSALASSSAESDCDNHDLPCTVFELEQPIKLRAGFSKNLSLNLGEQLKQNIEKCDTEVSEMSSGGPSDDFDQKVSSKNEAYNENSNEKETLLESQTPPANTSSSTEKVSVDTCKVIQVVIKEPQSSHEKKKELKRTSFITGLKPKQNYLSKRTRIAHQPKSALSVANPTMQPSQTSVTPVTQEKTLSVDEIFAKIFSEGESKNESKSEAENLTTETPEQPVNTTSTSFKGSSKVQVLNRQQDAADLKSSSKKQKNAMPNDKPQPKPKNIGSLIKEINSKSCRLNDCVKTGISSNKTVKVNNEDSDVLLRRDNESEPHSHPKSFQTNLNTRANIKSSNEKIKCISTNQTLDKTENITEGLQIQLKQNKNKIDDDIFADIFCDDKNTFNDMDKISNLIKKDSNEAHQNGRSCDNVLRAKKVLFEEELLKVSPDEVNKNKPQEKPKCTDRNQINSSNNKNCLPVNQITTLDHLSIDENVEIMSESEDSEDVDDPVENGFSECFPVKAKPVTNKMDADTFSDVFTVNSEKTNTLDHDDVSLKLEGKEKSNSDDEKNDITKSSSDSLQIVIKPTENQMDDDIFADVFTAQTRESKILSDDFQNLDNEQQSNANEDKNEQLVNEKVKMASTELKEASPSLVPSSRTSNFDSTTFNDENAVASTSTNTDSPSTSEIQPKKPKRTLNEKQLEKLQDILETKERELVLDHNREDRMATSITDQMYLEAQELLRLFGVPFVVAPMEAEAQCAFLDAAGLTQGTITDDSDIWLFGGRKVYKNFFDQKKFVLEFQSENIQQYFKLSRSHLVLLALLVGSDYTVGLTGVGPVTALEILATFPLTAPDSRDPHQLLGSLQRFKQWWQSQPQSFTSLAKKLRNLDLHEGFPSSAVVSAYLQPMVDESREPFSWGSPDLLGLRDFAERRFGWNRERIDQLLLPAVNRLNKRTSQLTLHTFFGALPNIPAHREQMSRRVQTAVNRLEGGSEDFQPQQPRPRQPRGRGRGRGAVRGGGEARGRGRQPADENDELPGTSNKAPEVIPQREKDRQEAMKRKQQAIALLKSKKPKGMKKRKNVRQTKAQADLSESSSDD